MHKHKEGIQRMKKLAGIVMMLIMALLLFLLQMGCAESSLAATVPEAHQTVSEETAENDAFRTYSHNGSVTLIDGSCSDNPVNSFDDASAVVKGVLDALGGDENTQLEPWRLLTDASGNHYYVFQQMFDNTTILGGAVKVMTDEAGHMLGLSSSIVSDLPEAADSETITAEEAETLVLDYAQRTRQQTLHVVEGRTDRMILPVTLVIDVEAEDGEGSRYVWVVYTDNPDSHISHTFDLPYLAHYVTISGEYLYSLPTIIPGDTAATSGFDASYVFAFMEPVDYTGYVDLSTGEEQEITVTVMRDKRTGMYYLGNLERRIVVADCWEFLYGGGQVVLEYSADNLEWDQVGLLSLYNYCRAYDYYREIGWSGVDGMDTPILILNNFCDRNHKPVNNAAYAGGYLGWQIFLASQANDFSQCLDVLAHEYTHGVTGSVMTYNAYMNDYGAINEAMSDIQGNTCQLLMESTDTISWEIADESTSVIRSMSEPHAFGQPEFTWDVYYMPNAKTPTLLNDQGGVHSNSSLLNYLAWYLYEKAGMTYEEGRAFWFSVDCAMVPGTDYSQLSELLPFALRLSGLEKYETEMERALDATRLGRTKIPEILDADRAMITLTMPEQGVFGDEQWILQMYSVNLNKLFTTVSSLFSSVLSGDFSELPSFVQTILSTEDSSEILYTVQEWTIETIEKELRAWLKERLTGVFFYGTTNAGQDGSTMRMVCMPGHGIPLLIHGVWNDSTSKLEQEHVLAYMVGEWIDLNGTDAAEDTDDGTLSPEMQAAVDRLAEEGIHGIDDVLDLFFLHVPGGTVIELPLTGLEGMQPVEGNTFNEASEETDEAFQPRKSRPKLNDTSEID